MNESEREKQRARNSATYVALMGLLIVGGLLLLMVTAILPDAMRGFVVVFLIFSGMLSFHYFTWGRAMERTDRQKKKSDSTSDS